MARPGPRPKGDRIAITVRLPRTHRGLYEVAAQRAGLPLGDYIALQLARGHDLEDPDYVHRSSNRAQHVLPLGA